MEFFLLQQALKQSIQLGKEKNNAFFILSLMHKRLILFIFYEACNQAKEAKQLI